MRKIGELKGKPIVEGNPNEVKNNQIHAKTEGDNITLSERKNGSLETISGSSSGGSSSKYAPRYFSIDWDKADENWTNIFDITNDTYKVLQIFSTVKIRYEGLPVISQYGTVASTTYVEAFSYIPCCINDVIYKAFNLPYKGIVTFEQCIEVINTIGSSLELPQITLNGITEITEEEYYKID